MCNCMHGIFVIIVNHKTMIKITSVRKQLNALIFKLFNAQKEANSCIKVLQVDIMLFIAPSFIIEVDIRRKIKLFRLFRFA